MSHRGPPKVNLYEDPEVALRRQVDAAVSDGPTAEIPLDVYFGVDRTAQWIRSNSYKRVALQFPDHLLRYAPTVSAELQSRTTLPDHIVSTFVLGDTSYGQCCVDEVAAEHIEADCIVHFGPACLSVTRRLPVFYVFGRKQLDFRDLLAKVATELNPTDHIVIMYDVIYQHAMEELERVLRVEKGFVNVVVARVNPLFNQQYGEGQASEESLVVATNTSDREEFCGRWFRRHAGVTMDQYSILYIGSEGRTLTNLIMTYNQCKLFTYLPDTLEYRKETINANKMLMKRFYLIEKAKDADIIGILVGTLSVSKYLDMIEHLKDIITKAGKRYYIFVVGKLNVPKLANFQEIEMFVIVACPENSLIDSRDLYMPVITPHELEIALVRGKEWTNSYSTDFQKVLAEASSEPVIDPNDESSEEKSETRVSLINNKVRVNHKVLTANASSSMEVALRNENNALITTTTPSATSYFLKRSYQGLQQRLGQTEVTTAIEGQSGVPLLYDGEITDGM